MLLYICVYVYNKYNIFIYINVYVYKYIYIYIYIKRYTCTTMYVISF